jgi:hypothetical protein
MSESEHESPTSKIVVDEDWKKQVQAEKEALQQAREESKKAEQSPPEKAAAGDAAGSEDKLIEFPPASFAMLVSELGAQAIMAMDEAGQSQGNKRANLLGVARHAIDTLDVLETKCRGNLSEEESQILAQYLQATRLAYVQMASRKPQASS